MRRFSVSRRALSPVIGVTLLVVIAVVLSSLSAYYLLGLSDTTAPAPEVAFEFEATDRPLEYRLIHESGAQLRGGRVEIRGVATENAISDERFAAGERVALYPTDETVSVVWFNGEGESFVLDTFEAETTAPEPDRGCPWVRAQTNDGNSGITVPSGMVVSCDIVTSGSIDVETNAVVLGTTESLGSGNGVDVGGGEVYGPVSADGNVDLDGGATVYGPVTAGDDVTLANADVRGTITTTTSGGDVDLDGGTVTGDVVSDGDLDVDSGGTVEGAVVSDGGSITLGSSVVGGHVYGSLSGCSGATISGESCATYTAKSASDY